MIYYSSSYGPRFGAGHDLEISDECDKNYYNYSNLGKSYGVGMNVDGNTLAGEQFFKIIEIEFYLVK